MNSSIKKYLWIAIAVAVVVMLAMFVIPVLSALLLGFFGVCALLAASRWVFGLFGKTEQIDDQYNTNYQAHETASDPGRGRRMSIGRRREVEDAEVIREEERK